MKTLNLKFTALVAIAVLLGTVFFTSCSKNEVYEPNSIPKTRIQVNYSGEELFRGIFFGSNINIPLSQVKKISDYKATLSDDINLKLNYFENSIVEEIKKNHPDFFDNFKDRITSKDHYVIASILNESSLLLTKTMYETEEIRDEILFTERMRTEIDIDEFINDRGEIMQDELNAYILREYSSELNAIAVTPTIVAVWLVAAIVQTVALAINYYVAVFVKKTIHDGNIISENQSDLQKEILVNEIYENL